MYSIEKDGNPKEIGKYLVFFSNDFDDAGVLNWTGAIWEKLNPLGLMEFNYTVVDGPSHYIPIKDLTVWKTASQKPEKYGKYTVRRENGQEDTHIWNGSGWSYYKDVKYWREL
jgi:hypothetical protein